MHGRCITVLIQLQRLAQDLMSLFPGQGSRKPVALRFRAIHLAQQLDLLDIFHAFCNDVHFEVLPQRNDGLNDGTGISHAGHITNKRAVDLQRVIGIALEVGKRRVAGTKIINMQLHACGLELVQLSEHRILMIHE